MAFEPVKAGWLKFTPRTDAEAGAIVGSAEVLVDDSTAAGAVDGTGATDEAGADDGGTEDGGTTDGGTTDGGTTDGGTNDGGKDGGGVIGYCTCAPA